MMELLRIISNYGITDVFDEIYYYKSKRKIVLFRFNMLICILIGVIDFINHFR